MRLQNARPVARWTYSELNDRAETLAAHLQRSFGPLTNSVVPICLDRCSEIYVAVLAILKAGAAWCPIDPSFPPCRRHDLIARANAKTLIVNAQSPRDGKPDGVTSFNVTAIDCGSAQRADIPQ